MLEKLIIEADDSIQKDMDDEAFEAYVTLQRNTGN